MFDKDVLCRAALYNKFVTPDGIFDAELLLNLTPNEDKTRYSLSLASRFLCREVNGVHDYGQRAALTANKRFEGRQGRKPNPLTEEVHYVGFYEIFKEDVITVPLDYYSPTLYWKPEEGSDEHFQFDLDQNGKQSSQKQRRSDRRAAIGIIASRIWGPHRHIAQVDEPHREALEKIDLPELSPHAT